MILTEADAQLLTTSEKQKQTLNLEFLQRTIRGRTASSPFAEESATTPSALIKSSPHDLATSIYHHLCFSLSVSEMLWHLLELAVSGACPLAPKMSTDAFIFLVQAFAEQFACALIDWYFFDAVSVQLIAVL